MGVLCHNSAGYCDYNWVNPNMNREAGWVNTEAMKNVYQLVVPPPPGCVAWKTKDLEEYANLTCNTVDESGNSVGSQRFIGWTLKKQAWERWEGKTSRTVDDIFTLTNGCVFLFFVCKEISNSFLCLSFPLKIPMAWNEYGVILQAAQHIEEGIEGERVSGGHSSNIDGRSIEPV